MKHLFFLLTLMSIASFGFCQNKNNILKPEQTQAITLNNWQGFNEQQMGNLFQLLQQAKKSLPSADDLSAHGALMLNQFADSLSTVMQKQYADWHPAPKPKTDTTRKK